MGKLVCSTIALLLALALAVSAESPSRIAVETLLGAELSARLLREGELRNSLHDGPPRFIPEVSVQQMIRRRIAEMDLTVGTEVLILYENPKADFDSPQARLELYNILRSISTMEGIEYYSASRERMRTLFAQSYVIAGPDNRQRLPDPVVRRIPPVSRLHALQEDLTFGENLYVTQFSYTDGYFLMDSTNLTQMNYFIFPAVRAENSLTLILLIPAGRQILFYGAVGAHTIGLRGLARSREDSFYNRLKAIYGWFDQRVDGAF